MNVRETLENLRSGLASIHLGGDVLIERTLICAIAGGHLLIEDRPGTEKTLLARGLTAFWAENSPAFRAHLTSFPLISSVRQSREPMACILSPAQSSPTALV